MVLWKATSLRLRQIVRAVDVVAMPQRLFPHLAPVLVLSTLVVTVPGFQHLQYEPEATVRDASSASPSVVERLVVGDMVVDWIGGAPESVAEDAAVVSSDAEATVPVLHEDGDRPSEPTEEYAAAEHAPEEVSEDHEAVRGGYALFSATARWLPNGYTIRLTGSDSRIEHFRSEVVRAAGAATTLTGVPVRVAPGVGGPVDPGRGEIAFVLGDGPCGPSVAGCGGPALTSREVVSGRIWINPSGLSHSPAQRANVVVHELGHALGLQHFDGSWTDGRQVMYPRITGIATFRAGDGAGLRRLSGADDRSAGAVTSRTYAAGRAHVTGTVSSGSRVRITTGSVVAHVEANGGRFSGSVPMPAGTHLVCASSVDAAPGFRRELGCASVDAPGTPMGRVDGVTDSFETLHLRGWAVDPQTAEPVQVHVRRNGVLVASLRADARRGDLGELARHYGTAHGFDAQIPAEAGLNRVCVRVIGVAAGGDWSPGCTDVWHAVDPVGALESVRAEGLGASVSGWALDPNSPEPVSITVVVHGDPPSIGGRSRASDDRPDVARRYPAHGSGHGFTHFVALRPGRHEVCVTATNVGLGRDRSLGCQHVAVDPPTAAPAPATAAAAGQVVDVGRDTAASPQQLVEAVPAPLLGR